MLYNLLSVVYVVMRSYRDRDAIRLSVLGDRDINIVPMQVSSVHTVLLPQVHSAYSESDWRTRGIEEAPRVRGGLKFAKSNWFPAIFGRFRQFFLKIDDKTTSVSGFLFSFKFTAFDFIDNDRHINIVSWQILRYGVQSTIMGRFCCFMLKCRLKLLLFQVFTSDSDSSPWTLLETAYISINKRSESSYQPTTLVVRFLLFRNHAMFGDQYLQTGEGWPHEVSSAYWQH